GGVLMVAVAMLVARPQLDGVGAALPVLVVIGVFDVLANALFAVASTKAILPVVAVGSSMYPAFTVALAHGVLGERLARLPWVGGRGAGRGGRGADSRRRLGRGRQLEACQLGQLRNRLLRFAMADRRHSHRLGAIAVLLEVIHEEALLGRELEPLGGEAVDLGL